MLGRRRGVEAFLSKGRNGKGRPRRDRSAHPCGCLPYTDGDDGEPCRTAIYSLRRRPNKPKYSAPATFLNPFHNFYALAIPATRNSFSPATRIFINSSVVPTARTFANTPKVLSLLVEPSPKIV